MDEMCNKVNFIHPKRLYMLADPFSIKISLPVFAFINAISLNTQSNFTLIYLTNKLLQHCKHYPV